MRAVSLGSRKNLCVNPSVSKLSSLARMNDKCKDLQKKKDQPDPTVRSLSVACVVETFLRRWVRLSGFAALRATLTPGGSAHVQTGKSKKVAGCPFLDPEKLNKLKDHILVGADGGSSWQSFRGSAAHWTDIVCCTPIAG